MIPIKKSQGSGEDAASVPHRERNSRSRERTHPARITTKEVDEAAADFMQSERQKRIPRLPVGHRVFPGNICISLNDEVVHGIGSQRRIQYGDIVKLDSA